MQETASVRKAVVNTRAVDPRASGVVVVNDAAELALIYEPDLVGVVWPTRLRDADFALSTSRLRTVLSQGEPWPPALLPLRDVVEVFACLGDADTVGLRAAVLDAPMCPSFHVDQVELRAVLTLRGVGTQILGVDGQVFQAKAGDLVVMKGTRLHSTGCRHRSPPMQEGATRVVITLDLL
jgi:hypothetical protein